MRAYLFDSKELIYPDDIPEKELSLSTFFGILHGYRKQGKRIHVDRGTEIYDQKGDEIYENDVVEIRYDLTRLEIAEGMKPILRGWISYEDGSFVAVNHDQEWMEYLGNDLHPGCNYVVKIIGNRHDKSKTI